MSSSDAYYEERLYPLQDGVLRLVIELGAPLYLTGGTALSRGYFGHRYSDDLDLFVNGDPRYGEWVDLFAATLEHAQERGELGFLSAATIRTSDFSRLTVTAARDPDIELKIDLVNDSAPHFGEPITRAVLGRIDALRNILSNKMGATLRFAGKDLADIWIICRNRSFNWPVVWEEAQAKEAGLDPAVVAEVISGVPLSELEAVRWRNSPADCPAVRDDLEVIARDIVRGGENSLGYDKAALEQ